MRIVSGDTGRGHATVHEVVHDVCAAIGMIRMPTTVEELTLNASAFMTAGDGLPQCFAAVDGTHVAVKDLEVRAEPPAVEDVELVALLQAYNAMFQDVVQVHEDDEGDEEAVRGLMLPRTL
ncbi:hypothetical protein QJQ45_022180, partial [Haematococcus lacustris]